MKIDSYGCLVMEKDGMPGDLGDSCAESGRLLVLCQGYDYKAIELESFVTSEGFVRHPLAPPGWREDDFTSDQMVYLLMAAWLRKKELFNYIVSNLDLMKKPKSVDVRAIASRNFHLLGVTALAQIAINKLPWRWSDDDSLKGKWWKFVSSKDSTVGYLSVFVTMTFLRKIGIMWPLAFFDREIYLSKSKEYYANQPSSKWFTDLMDGAV